MMKKPELFAQAAADTKLPAEVREVLRFEGEVRQAAGERQRRLLVETPLPTSFPYARQQRVELLTEAGLAKEALSLLGGSQVVLGGRDVVRLALEALATAGDREQVRREIAGLLAPAKKIGSPELTLVAQHLVAHPDASSLARLAGALPRVAGASPEQMLEVHLNLLCATGASGDAEQFAEVKKAALAGGLIGAPLTQRMEDFFFGERRHKRVDILLPGIPFMPLDLSYILLAKYLVVK